MLPALSRGLKEPRNPNADDDNSQDKGRRVPLDHIPNVGYELIHATFCKLSQKFLRQSAFLIPSSPVLYSSLIDHL